MGRILYDTDVVQWEFDEDTQLPVGARGKNGTRIGIQAVIDITAAQALAPTSAMLADTASVYRLNVAPFTRFISNGSTLVPLAAAASVEPGWATVEATRGGAPATVIQFRGAADTAASLGTIGLIINAASDTAAGNRLAASDADWSSDINGAATAGRTRMVGPVGGAITRVHIGQLGLTAPLTDNASGPVLAASNQMTELNFDSALNVTALLVVEGGPTNYAGAAGTGSARYVTVYGLSPVAA